MSNDEDFFSFMGLPKALTTDHRPLRLRLDLPGGANDDMLLPQRIVGIEDLCGGINYRLLCVSTHARLPLKQLIAVPATLEFVTDLRAVRSVCGIITQAGSGDSDGGLATYQLVLRDALAVLEKRCNTRVFRHMNEVEIVRQILNEWRLKCPALGACLRLETDESFALCEYPPREFTMQYNESDAAFVRRLLKRRGIGWFIRPRAEDGASMHALVLFNDVQSLDQNAAGVVRYHHHDAAEERDAITSWNAVRLLGAGKVTRYSWDYRNPSARSFMLVDAASGIDQGVSGNELAASLDDYQVLAPHAGDDNDDLARLGRLRMRRHDYESKCFYGEGSVRDFCAGEWFTLHDHPEVEQHPAAERDFVVTELALTAQNNLPKALAERLERLFLHNRWIEEADDLSGTCRDDHAADGLRVRVRFTAVRRGVPIVPAYDARSDVPQAAMQSAIVVGPPGEEVHCDQLGRVRIRFPATRPEDHEPGGAGASETDADSAWVRVASNWAGNGPGSVQQCGTVGLPRIGTEVLVSFLGGDPDKPVIVGQLYNQNAHPPALSTRGELPDHRYLAGIRSREIHGQRANQLLLDDTNGEISAQLASDHGSSQLNLGYLVKEREAGHGEPRGEGAELRSDLAVAVRGAQGVLIAASGGGGVSGKQLERAELTHIVAGLQKLADQLSALAQRCAGEAPHGTELQQLAGKVRQLHDGGMEIVAIEGPMGVALGSGQGLLVGAATDVDIASSGDTRVSAGGKAVIHAATSLGLFANQHDLLATAASGKVQVQAQNDAMTLLAKKVLDIISTTDWINLSARQGIRIHGGGSELVLSAAGIEGYTAGTLVMHASEHQFRGACGKEAKFPGATVCPTQTAAAAQAGSAAVGVKP